MDIVGAYENLARARLLLVAVDAETADADELLATLDPVMRRAYALAASAVNPDSFPFNG
jgi:50S ribosomal subunit-associated GTPase HflX